MKSLRILSLVLILVLILGATTLASAGDHEFRGVVHAIEGNYGVHHMRIPLLGFALFFVRPEGISGLKLAVFENFHSPAAAADLSRLVEDSLGPEWHPFIRVKARDNGGNEGETTLIYANPTGGTMRMMIVNIESSEATVVELKLNERTIRKWLSDTDEEAELQSGHGQSRAND
jgi:hypothetical protein